MHTSQSMHSCMMPVQGENVFFLEGPAGSGKTTVVRAVLEYLDRIGRRAIVVAATGVAAMLLPGGMTAHRFFDLSHKWCVSQIIILFKSAGYYIAYWSVASEIQTIVPSELCSGSR